MLEEGGKYGQKESKNFQRGSFPLLPAPMGGSGIEPVQKFRGQGGRDQFFAIYADVFYGRPLALAINISMCNLFSF